MTAHSISSGVNKQALDETLAFFFFPCARHLFIYLFASRNEPGVIKARSHCSALLKQRGTARCPVYFLCFFTLLSGKNMPCHFPGGSLGQCLSVKGHHGAASDSFLSIRFFFRFGFVFSFYCNHSAPLLRWFPSCSSAVSEVERRKSVTEQLRNKQQIMASMRKPWIHLSLST